MKYKGYTASITTVDEEHGLIHGVIADINDVVTFEGRNAEELAQAFRDSVDDYLDFCKEEGERPEKPFSGKFLVRIHPQLHRQTALAARKAEQSLNQYVATVLKCVIGEVTGEQARRPTRPTEASSRSPWGSVQKEPFQERLRTIRERGKKGRRARHALQQAPRKKNARQ